MGAPSTLSITSAWLVYKGAAGSSYMALGTRGAVVDHDALCLEVEGLVYTIVVCLDRRGGDRVGGVFGRAGSLATQHRVGAHVDGEAGNVAARVVLADRLDGGSKAVSAAGDEVEDGAANDVAGQGADDIAPRGADVADVGGEIEVHDDIQAVLGSLLEVFALVAHVLADGALHGDAWGGGGSGVATQGRDGGRGEGRGAAVVHVGGGEEVNAHGGGIGLWRCGLAHGGRPGLGLQPHGLGAEHTSGGGYVESEVGEVEVEVVVVVAEMEAGVGVVVWWRWVVAWCSVCGVR